ncbi:hemicentin-1-like [Cydia pomonella]|uniref:hemicentin-1-like n=1 Tax=Cydia pomonella TaxID=82600 RepID=UPI002ADE9534|nr:hemicentin-1-like [Cydia pomonella]
MYKIVQISLLISNIALSFTLSNTKDEKSSLVFVFDTTGSMYNDLKQLREGAEMILDTALEESSIIADFVFVPFHDPGVGPATVTHNKTVFHDALNIVRVYGGGDCPEKSLTGLQLALNVSRPRSFVYVFTDATAHDHRLVGKVLDLVQRKQSQVVFVLTGHCDDLKKPSYLVYPQIAAASSGQVFYLKKTNVHKVLDFVRSSIKARSVNLGTVTNPAGYNYTREIPVDSSLDEVTVSVSGSKPKIQVFSPTGVQLTGPPELVTTLDLAEIMVVKVLQPEPGNWSITVGSEAEHSVKVVGLSNLTFHHGFSVQRPGSPAETSYRPLQGAYNFMMLSLTHIDKSVRVSHAEILSLDGNTLFEIPLKEVDAANKIYLAEAFIPPDDLFYIAINGMDEDGQEIRRVGATAVQAKAPDAPYLTAPKKIRALRHDTVALHCDVESLVPVNVFWMKDGTKIQPQISSLQSTSVQYVIRNMSEENVGTYVCTARNVAGVKQITTEVELIAEPPVVTMTASSETLMAGEDLSIYCSVASEITLTTYQLTFTGRDSQNETYLDVEAHNDGVYYFNKVIENVKEKDSGVYSCKAAHEGKCNYQNIFCIVCGQSSKTLTITITTPPTAHILGPHTLPRVLHTSIQLVCIVEHCSEVQWLYNSAVVERRSVNGSDNAVLERAVDGDGVWTCTALKGDYKVSDFVQIIALIKPEVEINGDKNITLLNGTAYSISCLVKAKPEPRIIWHRETETFLNNTVSVISPNVYRSVLEIDSKTTKVDGTYFCFGENAAGIHQDSVTVSVRTPMRLLQGFSDISTQLYSNVTLVCQIESYPTAQIKWYHNTTEISTKQNIRMSSDNIAIERVDFDDLGLYVCKASNGYEELVVNGTLSVYGLETPALAKEPRTVVSTKGNTTILTCSVLRGNPTPTLSWQFLPDSSQEFSHLPRNMTSQDLTAVIISNVTIDRAGLYRCIAENVLGRDYYDVKLVVQYPPEIESNEIDPKPLEIEAGQPLTLSCHAEGLPKPWVTWTKDLMPIGYTKNMYLNNNQELVIEKVTEYDSGLFTCNATSILGSTQKNFTVIVYVPPKITGPIMEPGPQQFVEGQLVELPCQAHGYPRPEVTWLQNGDEINHDRKYIDEFGMRFVANLTDFGEYTCIVKNKYGNTSFSYNVYIWVPPSIEPPLDTDTDVLIGTDVSLNCDAVGFPLPVIYWEFNGTVINKNSSNLSFNEYGTMNITSASAKQEGLYACLAENIAGVARKNFDLRVNEPPRILEDNYTGPYIATEKDLLLKIKCRATGKPRPYIYWMKDDVYLDKDSRYDVDIDGTLAIKSPSEDLSGFYTCLAKNKVGAANKTVPVEIYTLPSKLQADESQSTITFVEGTDVSAECPIKASRNSSVTWYKDAKLISHGHLLLANISRLNESTYACVVTNAIGSTHTIVRVLVEWPPRFIKEEKGDVTVVRGEDRWLECDVDARPSATIKWMANSRVMLGEDRPRLKLINLQLHHTGVYKCIASNKHGTVVRQFNVDVLVPPFISEFDLLDVQLKQGMNATLECEARGSPRPIIEWTYSNPSWKLVNSSLTTTNVSNTSEGLFRCSARNIAGSAHIVYNVAIAAPAVIEEIVLYNEKGSTVEGHVELVVGSTARLSCKASGRPTPKIQWIKNGKTLSENQQDINYADLVFSNVNTSSSGVYSCVAINEGGMDGRRSKVDVLEPPKIFKSLFQNWNSTETETRLEVISGQAFNLHCHPYGNPMPEVYWFKDGVPLRLFDESMVSTDFGEVMQSREARPEQSGDYICVARNCVGNTSIVYTVDVLVPPPPSKDSHTTIIRVGRPLTLTCPIEGSPSPYVSWIKQPYTELINTSRLSLSQDNVTLNIPKTETFDSGLYSCIMTNKVGTTEVMFDVIIEKPPSIAGNVGANISETRIVPLRRSLVLKCEVDGHPTPRISWLKDTLPLSGGSSNIHQVLSNSLLAVWSLTPRDAGQYICVAENSAGSTHRRYNVVAQVPGKWSEWSAWSFCNVTCGLGRQARGRLCQYSDTTATVDENSKSDKFLLDQTACKGPRAEQRKCHMPPCEEEEGQWSGWAKWSACSSSCGTGTQARTRRCRKGRCQGDNVQIRKCPDLPKCNLSANEVFNTDEDEFDNSPYTPEAAFEFQPEVVDTEDFYTPATFKPPVYEGHVLPNPNQGPCQPGFTHNDTIQSCDDIDECSINNNHCHMTQMCVNTVGGYQCGCQPGYSSLGAGLRCMDMNECELDTDGCEYACVNVAGGYVCACPRHLRLHADRRHCYQPSSLHDPYGNTETEYLSALVESPAKYRNTRN